MPPVCTRRDKNTYPTRDLRTTVHIHRIHSRDIFQENHLCEVHVQYYTTVFSRLGVTFFENHTYSHSVECTYAVTYGVYICIYPYPVSGKRTRGTREH
eukprot:3608484-Pyramimonas_sp.AAC.1